MFTWRLVPETFLQFWNEGSPRNICRMENKSIEERFCKPRAAGTGSVESTRFLYVAGVGDELGSDATKIRRFFALFGELDNSDGDAVVMIANRRYCYVCFAAAESAAKALDFVSDKAKCTADHLLSAIGVPKIVVNYAIEKSSIASTTSELECTSSVRNMGVKIPGCYIVPAFITEGEEEALLQELAGPEAVWKETLSRRVQVP